MKRCNHEVTFYILSNKLHCNIKNDTQNEKKIEILCYMLALSEKTKISLIKMLKKCQISLKSIQI